MQALAHALSPLAPVAPVRNVRRSACAPLERAGASQAVTGHEDRIALEIISGRDRAKIAADAESALGVIRGKWKVEILVNLLSGPIRLGHPAAHAQDQATMYYANAYADHYGVPRALVDAIIEQESDWNPLAQSVKDAEGLMQLMPATAAMYGVRNRYDILENLSGGVRYLADLLSEFHGDMRLAVAAYYCGSCGWLKSSRARAREQRSTGRRFSVSPTGWAT